jgi:hypothetical protein
MRETMTNYGIIAPDLMPWPSFGLPLLFILYIFVVDSYITKTL